MKKKITEEQVWNIVLPFLLLAGAAYVIFLFVVTAGIFQSDQ